MPFINLKKWEALCQKASRLPPVLNLNFKGPYDRSVHGWYFFVPKSITELNREAKSKTSLRVGFFLDFINFIFASFAARIKKYLWMLNISIQSYKFLFWHGKKSKSELWYFCGKQTNKIQLFEILCVLTHTRFEILEFCLFLFYRNITILISNFFPC